MQFQNSLMYNAFPQFIHTTAFQAIITVTSQWHKNNKTKNVNKTPMGYFQGMEVSDYLSLWIQHK